MEGRKPPAVLLAVRRPFRVCVSVWSGGVVPQLIIAAMKLLRNCFFTALFVVLVFLFGLDDRMLTSNIHIYTHTSTMGYCVYFLFVCGSKKKRDKVLGFFGVYQQGRIYLLIMVSGALHTHKHMQTLDQCSDRTFSLTDESVINLVPSAGRNKSLPQTRTELIRGQLVVGVASIHGKPCL